MAIRNSAADLPDDERDLYFDAVLELKKKFVNGSSTSVYDQFVAVHLAVVTLAFVFSDPAGPPGNVVPGSATGPAQGINGAHGGSVFLPWHREYLRRYEIELQKIHSSVTLPYWDWTDHAGTQTKVFINDFMGDRGPATPPNGGPVTTGPFKAGPDWPILEELHIRWPNPLFSAPTVPLGTALLRQESDIDNLAEIGTIKNLLEIKAYAPFRAELESGPLLHGHGHVWIGGSMLPMTSPNDPMFFMHHAMVDRIWSIWQQKRRAEWEGQPANAGKTYSYATHYSGGQYGHQLYDPMWPWDGGMSGPATVIQDAPGVPGTPAPVRPYFLPDTVTLPDQQDVVRPADLLDPAAYGVTYTNPDQFD